MNLSRKIFGVALAVALFSTQITPVLATGPSTAEVTGNILEYNAEAYIVPTSLKLAFNPKASSTNFLITGYDEVDKTNGAYETGGLYFNYSDTTSKYVYNDTASKGGTDFTTELAKTAPLYKARTSQEQVVSLNYGIVNETSKAKTINVKFGVSYTADTSKTPITFVDTAAETASYVAGTVENGAKYGEMKIYLAVAPSTAAPTVAHYERAKKSSSDTYDGTATYYIKQADGTFTKVLSNASEDFDNGDYYLPTTTIGTDILAPDVSDVTMTKSRTGNVVFKKNSDDLIKTEIGFKLGAAEYGLKEGQFIDWDTTSSNLSSKYELKSLATSGGGVAAFTFTGAMNTNTEWDKAEASSIKITPTYEIADATGNETMVATPSGGDAAWNEYVLPTDAFLFESNGATAYVTLADGLKAEAAKISKVTINGIEVDTSKISVTGSGKVAIADGYFNGTNTILITYDGTTYKMVYEKS